MTKYLKDYNLPNRFKLCRLEKKLSQPQLSKALGFKSSKAVIYGYETNKRIPNVPTLIKMKNIFNVSLDYLLCLDNYKNHIDYINNALGINNELLDLLLLVTDNERSIKRVNFYIVNHYKENNNALNNNR